jgi:glyoxylate reductase
MPKVLVTRPILEPGMSILKDNSDVILPAKPPTKEELLEYVTNIEGLVCHLTDRVDKDIMDRANKLRVISTVSVGVDHIDVDEATKRGILVTYTPGVLTETTADLAWALIMAASRRVAEGDRLIRKGEWKKWNIDFMLGYDVYGSTLGIIGLGRIGQAVARRAKGFDMRIIYYSRRRKPEVERELGIEYRPLDELLKESDIISLNVPLTEDTFHLIDEKRLRLMKPTAILVNTSRGQVIDEEALIRALKEGWIAGAGLDVFEREPLPKDSPLTKLDNVVLTPHIGSASYATRRKMSEIAAINVIGVLQGKMPLHLYNPEALKAKRPKRFKR